jgi:hypothetical protein
VAVAATSPGRLRSYLRERRGAIALLFVAPSIPELLTGSTPITRLVTDPFGFLLSFGLDMALYGTGALLIRELVVRTGKGWASILLLGAAYGIAEEGVAVHTFFQPSGNPVGLLATYGHAFGVNWLWALGLTIFHATYSIALPILWVHLWFPELRTTRWMRSRSLGIDACLYFATVGLFAFLVPHGPSPAALALFLGISLTLVVAAFRIPADLLRARPGRARLGRTGLVLAGALGFLAWALVLLVAGIGRIPAVAAAALLVAIDLGALGLVVGRVGREDLRLSEYRFATGMLGALFVWDVVTEFQVPGILLVAALFGYLHWRLGRSVLAPVDAPVPPGAHGLPLAP